MQRIQINKGIWFNLYSDRLGVMTSQFNPDWRVVYIGYERWQDATKAVAFLSKDNRTTKREARKAERLDQYPFEVKCWGVTEAGLKALIKKFATPQPAEAKLPDQTPKGVTVVLTKHHNNEQLISVHIRRESTKLSEAATPIPTTHKQAYIEQCTRLGCTIIDRTERHLAAVS